MRTLLSEFSPTLQGEALPPLVLLLTPGNGSVSHVDRLVTMYSPLSVGPQPFLGYEFVLEEAAAPMLLHHALGMHLRARPRRPMPPLTVGTWVLVQTRDAQQHHANHQARKSGHTDLEMK